MTKLHLRSRLNTLFGRESKAEPREIKIEWSPLELKKRELRELIDSLAASNILVGQDPTERNQWDISNGIQRYMVMHLRTPDELEIHYADPVQRTVVAFESTMEQARSDIGRIIERQDVDAVGVMQEIRNDAVLSGYLITAKEVRIYRTNGNLDHLLPSGNKDLLSHSPQAIRLVYHPVQNLVDIAFPLMQDDGTWCLLTEDCSALSAPALRERLREIAEQIRDSVLGRELRGLYAGRKPEDIENRPPEPGLHVFLNGRRSLEVWQSSPQGWREIEFGLKGSLREQVARLKTLLSDSVQGIGAISVLSSAGLQYRGKSEEVGDGGYWSMDKEGRLKVELRMGGLCQEKRLERNAVVSLEVLKEQVLPLLLQDLLSGLLGTAYVGRNVSYGRLDRNSVTLMRGVENTLLRSGPAAVRFYLSDGLDELVMAGLDPATG
ncbi:MAG: hypothetical protein KDK78_00070, partial [Chlamydiia bacterium]|nr:hypothetical protein [Chlamydiia bacterium]